MKVRKEITGSKNDNWETPEYIMKWVRAVFKNKSFFDPCPLAKNRGGGSLLYNLMDYLLTGKKEILLILRIILQINLNLLKKHTRNI